MHGTEDVGLNNSRSKIDAETLFVIRYFLSRSSMTHGDIGKLLGLQRAFVSKVANGSRYKNQVPIVIIKTNTEERK